MYLVGKFFRTGKYRLYRDGNTTKYSLIIACILVYEYESSFLPDVIAVRVGLSAESHRAVAVKELLEEGTARQPHPHSRVHRPVGV